MKGSSATASAPLNSSTITVLVGCAGAGRLRISLARWSRAYDFLGKCCSVWLPYCDRCLLLLAESER